MKIFCVYFHQHDPKMERQGIQSVQEFEQYFINSDTRLRLFGSISSSIRCFSLSTESYLNLILKKYQLESSAPNIYKALIEEIKSEEPDLVYFPAPQSLPEEIILQIRSFRKRILLVTYYGGKVYSRLDSLLPMYDIVLTGWKDVCSYINKFFQGGYYLPHFFDDELEQGIRTEKLRRKYFLSFCGALTHGGHEFNLRREYLESLLDHFNIQIFAPCPKGMSVGVGYYKLLVQKYLYRFAHAFPLLSEVIPVVKSYKNLEIEPDVSVFVSRKLVRQSNAPVFGGEYYRVLQQSLVTFNSYCRINICDGNVGALAGNVRTFEATGNGACLLTEHASNIREFFEPDSEVVTFRDQGELYDKAKYLYDNPACAEEIARRGYKRAHQEHSLTVRKGQILQLFNQSLLPSN